MKKLVLKSKQYQYLELSFKDWLQTLGYAESTVYSMPIQLREFFYFLELQNLNRLHQLQPNHIKNYYKYLTERTNQRKAGGLSNSYLCKHLQTLKNFSKYLKETGQGLIEIDIRAPEQQRNIKSILTKSEIKQLYQASDETPIGLRDKAMLSVFYGCGLRRNEGVQLDIADIYEDKIYVRKGKNYKERYVPITEEIKQNFNNYLFNSRPYFKNSKITPAFFMSLKGNRLNGQSLTSRLKQLQQKAGISKDIGLHTLRHSIATHLLQSGMKLSNIAKFLGHQSLESTQIYTHLSADLSDETL